MATRTINVSLLMQRPEKSRIEFTPDLTSVDGDVLLKKVYVFTTDASGDATIALPVKASGTIRYTYKLPTDQARYRSTGEFYLEAGSAIDLDDLITAGVVATDSVIEYIAANAVLQTGAQTVAGVKTFSSDPIIPDEAFGSGWNGSLEPPTKNAIYDQYQLIPFKDVFNIKAYGAVVDGVTNDAAAVIAATDAAIAAGGGTVYFPSGVTYYASNLGADGATTTPSLIFQGTGNSIITFGSTVPVLSIGNCNAVTFQNLVFIGTSGAIVPTYRTIVLGFNAQAVFNNCQFYGLGTSENDLAAGVITASSTPLIVTDCLFVGCSVPNGAVVTSSGGAGLRMNDTHFLDVGTFDGVAYSTASKAAGGAWVRCTSMPNIQGANLKTALITNCTFDEAPLWGVRFDGSVVANQYNATVDNCHFNTGVDRGGGAYSGAIYATEMRQVTVKDTTAGFVNNTTDYCAAEFNNVDTVVIDNLRLIYGAKYISLTGTTARLNLRRSTLQGNGTHATGVNNAATATIDTDGGV